MFFLVDDGAPKFVGMYPYLVEHPPSEYPKTRITGELYQVSDEEAIEQLDALEEGYR